MTKLTTYLFATYLLAALMIVLGVNAYADAGLATVSESEQAQAMVASAHVNFRIRVADKASLRIDHGAVNAVSNAGNLYIVQGQQPADAFISSEHVIELQQPVSRLSDAVTVAVL